MNRRRRNDDRPYKLFQKETTQFLIYMALLVSAANTLISLILEKLTAIITSIRAFINFLRS